MNTNDLQQQKAIIEDAFNQKLSICKNDKYTDVIDAIKLVIDNLDTGTLRVSEKIENIWITHHWIKKALMLYFQIMNNKLIKWGEGYFFDKCPLKFNKWNDAQFNDKKLRIVPPATVRYGAYIAENTVIMPSYINIGSYIDTGTMIDTWSTIGSCAQIGKYVHVSGGVGIGGVLEPIQVNPTIIEDHCFIGARSEIVEGVIVEKGSVISMGVFIGQSTKIYDRNTGHIHYGRVPSGSVVIPGSLPSLNKKFNTYCAIIIKTVDEKTRNKTKLNDLLRD